MKTFKREVLISTAVVIALLGLTSIVQAETRSTAPATPVAAVDAATQIPLTSDKPFVHVVYQDRSIKVQRAQDTGFELNGYWAQTVRKCPPFCLKPMQAAPGVKTVGEVEVFDFMEKQMRNGTGLLVDARTESWFKRGTIPGSVNVPFTTFKKEADSLEITEALELFGAKQRNADEESLVERALQQIGWAEDDMKTSDWDFTDAKNLVLWCNGPHCGQSPAAIRGLLKLGYPASKLAYFRGGMQTWQLWALTTVMPDSVAEGVRVSQITKP